MSTTVAVSHRRQRVVGALLGWMVGDALGAPFEFGPAGQYSARFPDPVLTGAAEMTGGGIWAPGEWTDDTDREPSFDASLKRRCAATGA